MRQWVCRERKIKNNKFILKFILKSHSSLLTFYCSVVLVGLFINITSFFYLLPLSLGNDWRCAELPPTLRTGETTKNNWKTRVSLMESTNLAMQEFTDPLVKNNTFYSINTGQVTFRLHPIALLFARHMTIQHRPWSQLNDVPGTVQK